MAHVPSSQGGQGIFGAQPTLQIYTVAILLAPPVHVARLAFEWLILISISACEKFWIAESNISTCLSGRLEKPEIN